MSAALRFLRKYRRPLVCCCTMLVMLTVSFGVWLVAVRPCEAKSLSVRLNDIYDTATPPIETELVQTFTTDQPLSSLAFVFHLVGGQPAGALRLELYDEDTGLLLAASTGRMEHLIEGQYAGLGLGTPLEAGTAGHYSLVLLPSYENDARIALACSSGAAPGWEEMPLSSDGRPLDGTLALLASTRQIGRFVSVFYWVVCLLLAALVTAGYWLLSRPKALPFHRLYALLAAGLGLVFCLVLPPYAAPDEQFHINQAFSFATRASTYLDLDGWHLSHIPLATSFRRPSDENAAVQDQNTTVFTWQAVTEGFFTASPDKFGSFTEHAGELQADLSNELYLASGLGVLVGFVLHLGFVPTLFLGRLANLAAHIALVAWAIKKAPFGKPVFAAAGLLPMTLHLAASYSRDSLLLGLAFLYTALCLNAAFGPYTALSRRQLGLLAAAGLLLAPAKSVYLPLCALCLLIPAARLGRRPRAKQAGFLAACLLVFALSGARYQIAGFLSQAIPAGPQQTVDAAAPEEAGQPAEASAEFGAGMPDPDSICFSAAYILAHPGLTVQLLARSAVENADHYIKSLVGGKLSYYSLDLGWGWVICCYLLLAFACLPPGSGTSAPPGNAGRITAARLWAGLLGLGCCGLAVLGCVSWTPTYYETIYGLQGRYFLPVLPTVLMALCPAEGWQTLSADAGRTAQNRLLLGFAAANAGVLLNTMLAVMAR